MENQSQTFAKALPKVLGILERVAIIVSMTGVVFKSMQWVYGNMFLLLGLMSFAMILFLKAFTIFPKSPYWISMLNKLGYIASSVGVVGILFTLLHFQGAKEQMLIATTSLMVVVIGTGILSFRYEETFPLLKPMLIRGIPILLSCVFLYFRLPAS
jgi:hypothetical protein